MPLGFHRCRLLLERRQVALDHSAAFLRRHVLLLLEGLALDLELHHTALDLVDFLRKRVNFNPQAACCFVHQVDGLVREEAVADIPIAQRGRGDDSAIGDAHTVVRLVAFLESTQNGDRVLDARLIDVYRLEAPLERRILFDVLTVFVERSRTHHAQLSPREHRLEHVAGIHRAFSLAGSHQRVHLVDEDDEPALAAGDLLEHRLEPLLELTAELRAGDERAEVERHQGLVLERLGHVAVHHPLCEAFGNRRLADSGLADEDGVVLRAAGEHLNHAANLLIAPDHRIEFALACRLGEIPRELRQRLVLVFRRLVGDRVRSSHRLERVEQSFSRDAERLEERGALRAFRIGESQQDVLDGDVLIAERLRERLGAVEHLRQLATELRRGIALLRIARELGVERRAQLRDGDAELLQDGNDDAILLVEHHAQEVCVVDERISGATRERERFGERFGRLDGQAVG